MDGADYLITWSFPLVLSLNRSLLFVRLQEMQYTFYSPFPIHHIILAENTLLALSWNFRTGHNMSRIVKSDVWRIESNIEWGNVQDQKSTNFTE